MPDSQTVPGKTGITGEGFLTDSWYLAAPSARLKPGAQERVMVLGEPVALGRTPAGEAFALRDICPHRLVPLSAGRQIETKGEWTLQCPYHGWRFGTDGGCRLMPSLTGDNPYDPAKVKVRRYRVHEANGAVYLYVAHDPRSPAPPAAAPPSFGPLPEKPGFVIEDVVNAHIDDAVIALMDRGQATFVADPRGRRAPSASLRQQSFVPAERGWATGRHAPCANAKLIRWVFGGDVQAETCFQLPGYRWDIISNDTARVLTLTCLTPEAPEKTRMTRFTWWTGAPLLHLAMPLAKRMGAQLLGPDGERVDLQDQGAADQKARLRVEASDVQARWYQSLKREWTAAHTANRAFENPVQPRVLKWMS